VEFRYTLRQQAGPAVRVYYIYIVYIERGIFYNTIHTPRYAHTDNYVLHPAHHDTWGLDYPLWYMVYII